MFPFFLALYNVSQVSIVALWATCFNWIFFILAGNEDMHETLDEFEFRLICNRVTALDCHQILVFAQYLENE